MKQLLKTAAHLAATIVVVPQLATFAIRSALMGKDRALEGSTQLLSLVPGIAGQYLRRAFLARALDGGCAASATIEFGTIFSQAGARLDANAYVGPRCHLGLVHIERDALVAATRQVGFPVGHASAQMGWRGLLSRPTWRILVYSAEEPPAKRGLVLVDGVDGSIVEWFVEDNPEDWSTFAA